MVNIIKYYLVDSENVNDNWLMLLDLAAGEDEIIIFYTKNSPHMSYMSVVKLLGNTTQKITFEECFEGNNALDFQLISYMGYLMSEASLGDGTEYIVMSNDTGFDAAVKFWKKKGFAVRRVNVNFCKIALHKQKSVEAETPIEATAPVVIETPAVTETPVAVEAPAVAEVSEDSEPVTHLPEFTESEEEPSVNSEVSEEATYLPEFAETEEQLSLTFEDTTEGNNEDKETEPVTFLPEFAETEDEPSKDPEEITYLPEFAEEKEEEETSPYPFNKQEVDEIINCITKDSLESLHETLVHIYGRDQGQKIYKTIKSNAYPYKQTIYSRKEKVTHITDIIFLHSELENPGDFVDFLEKNKNKTKNLNGIRSAINKTYGSASGIKYYSLFKPYFKIISAMK